MGLTPLNSDSIENLFFNFYSYDAISLEVDILNYLSGRFSEDLGRVSENAKQLQSKKILILKFEIVAKVCHYIENLGAFAYSFSKVHSDRNLIAKAFKIVSDYDVDAVKSFYESFEGNNTAQGRSLVKLRRIFCYPQLASNDPSLASLLSEALQNQYNVLKELGSCYTDRKLKLKEAYNAYKHGYRLLFAKHEKNDIDLVPFIDKHGSLDYVTVDNDSIRVYLDLKTKCSLLFQIMLNNHRIKQELIKHKKQCKKVDILFLEKDNYSNYKTQAKMLSVVIKIHNDRVTYLSRP